MLDPVRDVIRRERQKQDLSQQELADRAGVSRWQLLMFETGKAKVSLDFLLKVCRVLQLSEIMVGDLHIRAAAPDLPALVAARNAVATAMRVVEQYRQSARELDEVPAELAEAAAGLDALVENALKPAGSVKPIVSAAERLAATPPAKRGRTAAALRELSGEKEPRGRTRETKPAAQPNRKKTRTS